MLRLGLVNVYNDLEEWKVESFSLGFGDIEVLVKLFRNYMLGGVIMLLSWFVDGGDVNCVNGEVMVELIFKIFVMC